MVAVVQPLPAGPKQQVLGEIELTAASPLPQAQRALREGMMLLHLFEYTDARALFRQARALDPELFSAYWGEAMTHNAPLWNQIDLAAGRAVIEDWGKSPVARRARLESEREQAWLEALEILFSDAGKITRDRRYADAMAGIATRYPDDDEARLFYALALLGRNGGVRHHADYMRATALAIPVFQRQPRHPGAAHYLIHGVDDAVHAPLGLEAAQQLAEIAPDAPHAQHMASHIFLALGMWPETITANRRAVAVSERRKERPMTCGHYVVWLHYAKMQQGRFDEAAETVADCRRQAEHPAERFPERFELDADTSSFGSAIQMWARQLIDSRDWQQDGADWRPQPRDAVAPAMRIALIDGLSAFDNGDREQVRAARMAQETLTQALADELASRAERNEMDAFYLDRARVMVDELRALEAALAGDGKAAIAAAKIAHEREMTMPPAFGPPFVDLPAAELLGELQLRFDHPEAALHSFKQALELAPGRSRALTGIIQAARAANRPHAAQRALQILCDQWQGKDLDSCL